jgi:hypothetical protein
MFAKDVEVIAEEEFIHRWWYKYTTTPCTPSFKRRGNTTTTPCTPSFKMRGNTTTTPLHLLLQKDGEESLLPIFHQTGIIRKL